MTKNIFEKIKKVNEYNQEFWSARDLFKILGYSEYNKFLPTIERAKVACKSSKQAIESHFALVKKALNDIRKKSGLIISNRQTADYNLSRYACYLIAQNGDPRKDEIAKAQTYFAIQTRKQELSNQFAEDRNRVYLREKIREHNKRLASAAKSAGVVNFGSFQDFGYMGLYGALRQREIHDKKHLKPKDSILDHMGSEELAANLFRSTQTKAKLERENVLGQKKANKAHFRIGEKIRQTIQELGGTMPEKLPTPTNIKEAKKRLKKNSNNKPVKNTKT